MGQEIQSLNITNNSYKYYELPLVKQQDTIIDPIGASKEKNITNTSSQNIEEQLVEEQDTIIDDIGASKKQNITNTSSQNIEEPSLEEQDTMLTDGMQKQLDRLLGRAAKQTFATVNRKSLENVLEELSKLSKLSKLSNISGLPDKTTVLNMVDNANSLLKELDNLKGMNDFAALFGNPEDKSKVPLHIQAMNAQMDLSDKLRSIMTHVDSSSENYNILEEMQFKCNARAAEISRWAGQMKSLYDDKLQNETKLGDKTADGFTFDTKVSEALAELSAKMHGTADGLKKLASSNKEVRDFLQTLIDFANSKETGEITQKDYDTLSQQALKFQESLRNVALSGWLVNETDVSQRENKHVLTKKDIEKGNAQQSAESEKQTEREGQAKSMVQAGPWKLDSATLKKIAELLEKSQKEIQDEEALSRGALSEMMKRTIDAEMSIPESLQLLSSIIEILRTRLGLHSPLVDFLKSHNQVLKVLNELVNNPCKEELAKAQDKIDEALEGISFEKIRDELCTMGKSNKQTNIIVADFKKKFENINKYNLPESEQKMISGLLELLESENAWEKMNEIQDFNLFMSNNMRNDGKLYKKRIETVLSFIGRDMKTVMKDSKTRQFIEEVFHGNYPVSSLIETRLHGVKDEDIQVEAEDSKLTEKTSLGNGAANEVFLCTYSNGHSFVFKPELPGQVGLHRMNLGSELAYSDKTKLYHLNIASRKFAEFFGLQDTIVTTKAGVLKGQFGLFMEVAPGLNMQSKDKISQLMMQINAITDKVELYKNMFFQFNKLQWLDLLTGQEDRHAGNFMLAIPDNANNKTLSLKGIDNDLCFSENLVGVHKYMITSGQLTILNNELIQNKEKFNINFTGKDNAMWNRLKAMIKGSIQNTGKNYVVDMGRIYEMIKGCVPKNNGGRYVVDMGQLYNMINRNVPKNQGGKDVVNTNEIPKDELMGLYLGYVFRQVIGCQSYGMPSCITKTLYDKLMEFKGMSHDEKKVFIKSLLGEHISENAINACATRLEELIVYAEKLNNNKKVLDEQSDSWKNVYSDAKKEVEALRGLVDKNIPQGSPKNNACRSCKRVFSPDYFFNFMNQIGIDPVIK